MSHILHDELSKKQFPAIRTHFQYCLENTPFYQRKLASRGIAELSDLETFKSIPFTTKEDLQRDSQSFLSVNENQIADYSSTSGTLGKPIFMAMTKKDLERLALNEATTLQAAGLDQNDRIQLMTTMDRRFMAGLAYFLGTQSIGASMIRVGSGLPELQWDTILSLKPSAIIAVPSFIVKLIEYAAENEIDLNGTSVKKAICIGEALRDESFALNALGKRIRSDWDIELYSTYASTEMAAAFSECSKSCGGHLLPDLLYAEIVDEDGNQVEDDAYGELVVSTLGIEGMPLLRYKTGDICRFHYEVCECGNPNPRISPISGRKKHMIKFKGTTLYPPALFNLINEFEEVLNCVIELNTNDLGTDELVIRIHAKIENQDLLKGMNERFKAKLRVTPNIVFSSAKEIAKTQAADKNRKPIKFLDLRP